MNKYIGLIITAIFLFGCSSAPTKTSDETNISANRTVLNKAHSATPTEDFIKPKDSPAAANVNADLTIGNTTGTPLPRNPVKGNVPNEPMNPKAPKMLVKAPDNSVVYTEMNQAGTPIETRVFNNHPMLAKVERIYKDVENPEIKVYLKNGKIINLSNKKFDNILDAPAKNILAAIGGGQSVDNNYDQ